MEELDAAREQADKKYDTISQQVYDTRYAMKNLKSHLNDLANILDDSTISGSIDSIGGQFDQVVGSMEMTGEALEEASACLKEIDKKLKELEQETDPQKRCV